MEDVDNRIAEHFNKRIINSVLSGAATGVAGAMGLMDCLLNGSLAGLGLFILCFYLMVRLAR